MEDAFSCIGILGAIPFRRILPGRVFPFIQPCPIQQIVFPQSVIDGCKIVFFSQPIKPHGSSAIPCPDGCVPAVRVTAENIPLPIQRPVEVLGSAGILTGLVDGFAHPGVPCRFLGFGLLHHRQAVLTAQLVGCCPELGILAAALLVLLAVHIRYGIDNEVVMQVIRIHVSGDQHLKALAPDLAGQCHADLMALLRGDLTLAEALVGVERHHAVCFPKAFLYSPHIFPHMVCHAMDAGDKLGTLVQLGLGIIFCIVESLGKSIIFGLVRVGRIVKDALQAVLDCPNLSYRQ